MRSFNFATLLKLSLLAVTASLSISSKAQLGTPQTQADYTQKAFPVIYYIQQHPKLLNSIRKDRSLKSLSFKRNNLLKAQLSKETLGPIIQTGLGWGPASVKALGDSFIKLYTSQKAVRNMVSTLKATHQYALSDKLPDTAYLRSVWAQTFTSLQHIQNVYLLNGKTTYRAIDSSNLKPDDLTVYTLVKDSLQRWSEQHRENTFYTASVKTALLALELNQRDEAIRYDPIQAGMNNLPAASAKMVPFAQYTYSCLLVPGLGPEIIGESLSEGGKKRCRMAVQQFEKKLAPFIMVSGGHVHPFKTPYCEAVEMKKYLMDSLGIADSVIIIEPYARHTTTNLRNANRLINAFGLPFNKPVLIVTDSSQSAYINKGMKKTAMRDLGYLPYRDIKVLSKTLTLYYPQILSLQTDALEPLDP